MLALPHKRGRILACDISLVANKHGDHPWSTEEDLPITLTHNITEKIQRDTSYMVLGRDVVMKIVRSN